ncbi:MAG: gamma-glutamyltransferase [Planctomycetes bacterium]|nr:gamma-glutamyltransferase [Planctomycetota bacterium]
MRSRLICLLILVSLGTNRGLAAPQATGMVVSQNHIASDVAAETLRRGGNAVDAAVACAFALAVVHPAAGNLGGGGFIVVSLPGQEPTTFDFRETAPAAATAEMFLDEAGRYDASRHHESYLAVGTPGTVAGLWLAHGRLGRRPWRELLAPAIRLAKEGFPVTKQLASEFDRLRPSFEKHPSSLRVFSRPDGSPWRVGDRFIQADLAATLERIRDDGLRGFYEGKTAELICAQMQRGGGLITRDDLRSYRAVERAPVIGSYRNHKIVSMAPPSSGGVTLINMLNMLETFPVVRDPARRVHLVSETMRRGFADRARLLGDPDFNPPGQGLDLLEKEHGRRAAADIDLARASQSRIEGLSWMQPEGDQTTHLSVVDPDLGAVSMTYTLENSYGSKIVVEGAGFLLNDEMGDFNPLAGMTTEEGLIGTAPNLLAPGKRMLSSMTPTIVFDAENRPRLVVGTPGGRTIINTVYNIITSVIDLRFPIDQAVRVGRYHHQWFPDRILLEEALDEEGLADALRDMGHVVELRRQMGCASCIEIRWNRKGAWSLMPGVDPRYPDAGAATP